MAVRFPRKVDGAISAGYINPNTLYNGIKVQIYVTGVTTGTSLTWTLKSHFSKADAAGVAILATAAQTANGTYELTVYPGITAAANSKASDILGEFFSVAQAGTVGTATVKIKVILIP